MTTTQHQTLNPSFSNPDEMPEYVSIYDKPQKGKGRPKTCKLSDEQKKKELKRPTNDIIEIITNTAFCGKGFTMSKNKKVLKITFVFFSFCFLV